MKEATHGNDVNVEQSPEAIEKLVREQRLQMNLSKLHLYVNLVLNDKQNTPLMIGEVYAQTSYDAAICAALGEIIADKLGISRDAIMDRASELVEGKLDAIEQLHGIIIEPDKITKVAKNEQGQQGTDSGAAQKESGHRASSTDN